jgi:O-antigen ligase
VVAAIALGAPNAIANRWNQFVDQQAPSATLVRSRLGSTSNDGRLELWKIALNAFDANPLDGTGADTYEILYYEHRSETNSIINAHSLYIETLSISASSASCSCCCSCSARSSASLRYAART